MSFDKESFRKSIENGLDSKGMVIYCNDDDGDINGAIVFFIDSCWANSNYVYANLLYWYVADSVDGTKKGKIFTGLLDEAIWKITGFVDAFNVTMSVDNDVVAKNLERRGFKAFEKAYILEVNK